MSLNPFPTAMRPGPMVAATLALGLLLSMATQLRLSGLPLGPGELCLAAALAMLGSWVLRSRASRSGAVGTALVVFWLVIIAAQCIGVVAAGLIGDRHDVGLVIHDAATYPVLIATTLLCTSGPAVASRLREVGWHMVVIGAVLCLLQLACAAGLLTVPGVDPWYWDRLRGWTANPNQLALFCLILAFLGLHLAEGAAGWVPRAGASACTAVAIATGVLAKTNAFNLALAAAFALLVAIKVVRWLAAPEPRLSVRYVAAWALAAGLPMLILSALPMVAGGRGDLLAGSLGRDDSSATDDEAKLRLELWRNAISRSQETGLLGLGPGPHLPIPALLLDARWGIPFEPSNVEHPTPGGPPNFEAHNSFLELLLQGGLLAVVSFAGLIVLTVRQALRANRQVLAVSVVGMLLFGCFHVITRHPAVWFVIVTGLSAQRPPAVRGIGREAPRLTGGPTRLALA